jgi:hypothetical protein
MKCPGHESSKNKSVQEARREEVAGEEGRRKIVRQKVGERKEVFDAATV